MSKQSVTSVILAFPPRQAHQGVSLQQYCLDLDGTVIDLIPINEEDEMKFRPQFPNNAFNCRCAWSLRLAAIKFYGKPFVWLESDSIPLRPGWLRDLSVEYEKIGKPYLLSSDSNPPLDLVGGVGVYGPETKHDIPVHFRVSSWDLWMIREMDPRLLGRTPLIQHSYGIYNEGYAEEHRFPRDYRILRETSLIFHRDRHQDLIGLKRGSMFGL